MWFRNSLCYTTNQLVKSVRTNTNNNLVIRLKKNVKKYMKIFMNQKIIHNTVLEYSVARLLPELHHIIRYRSAVAVHDRNP